MEDRMRNRERKRDREKLWVGVSDESTVTNRVRMANTCQLLNLTPENVCSTALVIEHC